MLKQLLFSIVLLVFPGLFFYQNGSDPFDAYKEICLNARSAINRQDADSLILCKKQLNSLNGVIGFMEIAPDEFVTISPEEEESLDGHILFHEQYFVELLKTDFGRKGRLRSDLHVAMRGHKMILITHHVVPARGEGKYLFQGNEQIRFFLLSERPAPLSFTVSCPAADIELTSTHPVESGFAEYAWKMGPEFEPVYLTVRNHSDSPIAFLFAADGD